MWLKWATERIPGTASATGLHYHHHHWNSLCHRTDPLLATATAVTLASATAVILPTATAVILPTATAVILACLVVYGSIAWQSVAV